ncbi:DUF7344 domain-containing protein [Halogranum amylolyticum]|nr:hypothetical protein [Halogranum amylolyticum]
MILRSSRRRLLLHYLEQSDGTLSRGELARHVAAAEEGIEMEEVTTTDRKRVYVSLHQTHLPTMDDVGIIDYDEDRGTVELHEENARKYYQYLHFDPNVASSDADEGDDGDGSEAKSVDGDRPEDGSHAAAEGVEAERTADRAQNGMVDSLVNLFRTN